MKRRSLSAWTLRAIALTGRNVDFKDRVSPTWDGKAWHFSRLKHEIDVVHEIAHWILSPWRNEPNYGLGTDPDGGPNVRDHVTGADPQSPSEAACVLAEIGMQPSWVVEMRERYGDLSAALIAERIKWALDREEELSAILTVFLERYAGLDWKAGVHQCGFDRVVWHEDHHQEKFWGLVSEITKRGIDIEDPIPGMRSDAAG